MLTRTFCLAEAGDSLAGPGLKRQRLLIDIQEVAETDTTTC
jgi:hypothetical protein